MAAFCGGAGAGFCGACAGRARCWHRRGSAGHERIGRWRWRWGGQLGARVGGGGVLAAVCGVFGFGCVGVHLGVWVCIWVCWFGIRRNKAGGAGVAYGTWIRRTGRRVAVRGWRRRVLAGRAAPASPFAEGRGFCGPPLPHVSLLAPRPPSQFPCHGDCLRRDSPTLSSTTLGSFITRAMVARNIKP